MDIKTQVDSLRRELDKEQALVSGLEQQMRLTDQNLVKENRMLEELKQGVEKAKRSLQEAETKMQTQDQKVKNIENQKRTSEQDIKTRKVNLGRHEAELRNLSTQLQQQLTKK